ncbi:hypothetical protein [Nocardiopsis composta]|uniref:Uncharacterized protein n=1 Tax=Nocardiopsis composta TaxID=157465 RepID=A0A7W8VGG8_9ACTN|nr:hypothetical protein [Nocardiopsis composta]MBB5435160.1 hypothetical protein [Nocardiopsis composta]
MEDWDKIPHLRARDERRSRAPHPAEELLLITKVSEEANEAAELYRRMRGWGTNGATTATRRQVQHELCAAITAGMVALDRISPDGTARQVWAEYLDYGYTRAEQENTATGG